jgi:hypothetical protein
MINHGNPAKLDRNRVPRRLIVDLLDSGLLVPAHISARMGLFDDTFELSGIGIPACHFREFLGNNGAIVFEDDSLVRSVLGENDDKRVGFCEEYWLKSDPDAHESEPAFVKEPGTPNIVFSVDIGGNPSGRSARATYDDLYRLLDFLKGKLG